MDTYGLCRDSAIRPLTHSQYRHCLGRKSSHKRTAKQSAARCQNNAESPDHSRAGLGAAWHLVKQGYTVELLEAGESPGGLVAGWKSKAGRNVEVGIHGFWRPYHNIFSLCKELGLEPFTDWTPSNQYSPAGLEVEAPIFADQPLLPAPLGQFAYTDFKMIPLADRLTALGLMTAAADFDNSPDAWRRYDGMSARELFRQAGVSERLYRDAFNPMLLVGLFAPGEQCSAAACLGMLKFFILSHQADFDVVWCRGTTNNTIFQPWLERIEAAGGVFKPKHRVADFKLDADGRISAVVADTDDGQQVLPAGAVIMAVGINGLKRIVQGSSVLSQRPEFQRLSNLRSVDILAVRLWLDRRVQFPRPSNACSNFDDGVGWTFFDLTTLHDEFADEPGSVVEADFYHAGILLPMRDEDIVDKVMADIATCVPAIAGAKVLDYSVVRARNAVTHFAPGCYPSFLKNRTTFPNLFAAGDWVDDRHGSFSQEKAYVTGLRAANNVMAVMNAGGRPAHIQPLEQEEPQVLALRQAIRLGQRFQDAVDFTPLKDILPSVVR